jgi:phage terminase large subunit-like protein
MRLGRQELNGELLDDTPGALWQRAWIDDLRVQTAPDLQRVIVAIWQSLEVACRAMLLPTGPI